jgi:hypothetical protein
MAAVLSKLCHLEDKYANSLAVLTEKGRRLNNERVEGWKNDEEQDTK